MTSIANKRVRCVLAPSRALYSGFDQKQAGKVHGLGFCVRANKNQTAGLSEASSICLAIASRKSLGLGNTHAKTTAGE